jgi:hypothetical protein
VTGAFPPSNFTVPLIVTFPLTNQTTGARLALFLNVTVAPVATVTLEYLKTTAHLAAS